MTTLDALRQPQGITGYIGVRLDLGALADTLTPAQIEAVLQGIALVVTATTQEDTHAD